MTDLLNANQISSDPPAAPPAVESGPALSTPVSSKTKTQITGLPAYLSSLVPCILALKSQITQELESQLSRLLSLNPSRREAIATHLNRLAGHSQLQAGSPAPNLGSSLASTNAGLAGSNTLRRWIEGPRNSAQSAALQCYFEEVALIFLGQALLLKAWSDRGIRTWTQPDLGRLNWALSTTLKPMVPLDREGWHITRPNLYSWFNPSPIIQREIWITLETWRITDEGPNFLNALLGPIRQTKPEVFEPQGYDSRFFQAIWNQSPSFGLDFSSVAGPIKRNRVVFSPTLRDGSMVRTGPVSAAWIGLESSPFLLMLGELVQLWWGPSPPPLWVIGNGLEVHGRDQLALALGSPKPSLVSRITEMEACDAAIVLEEKTIRGQGKSIDSQRFRDQLDGIPYFKKLRSSGTSLGDLQACVSLSKLRPGGFLWWAREEPLSEADGKEMLNFALDRAQLICEWDFSELEHSLPLTISLFPKHLYLLIREPNVEKRLNHRPWRISLQGQIRSHVEIPLVLEDALQSIKLTRDQEFEQNAPHPRGQWKVHIHRSPTPQREWTEHWPDPTSQSLIRSLDQLRALSLPLASATTIRHTPEGDPSRNHLWSVQSSFHGFWLHQSTGSDGRRLITQPLPTQGQETKGSGFMVLVPDPNWVTPLAAYLKSEAVRRWLDHQAERRGERWILNEQVIKWIPVPRSLLKCLGFNIDAEKPSDSNFAAPLAGNWEKLTSNLMYDPFTARNGLKELNHLASDEQAGIRAQIFIRAARALEQFQAGQERMASVVSEDGHIRWRAFLEILPKGECVGIPFHPRLKLTGNLPSHLPVGKIDRVKLPSPGILLTTEIGLSLHIGADQPLLIDILWDQLQGLTHPTWSELLQYVQVPRRIDLAEATASDVLRSYGEQARRYRELQALLAECLGF